MLGLRGDNYRISALLKSTAYSGQEFKLYSDVEK